MNAKTPYTKEFRASHTVDYILCFSYNIYDNECEVFIMYRILMSKLEDDESIEKYVDCNVRIYDRMCIVSAIEPGYRVKYFIKDYFDWLIYTGYIKEIKSE